MIDHIGLNVPDLAAARRYYDRLMPLLGYEPFFDAERQFSYKRAEGKPGTNVFFYVTDEAGDFSRKRTGLQHLAFKLRSRAAVDAVHKHVVSEGGEIVRPPGIYAQYHSEYYAVFWLDPHRFLLEAVCHTAG